MKQILKNSVKAILPNLLLKKYIIKPLSVYNSIKPISPRKCNLCNYEGYFGAMGRPPRIDAECPSCGSLERHRLMMLAFGRDEVAVDIKDEDNVLHFAPEPILEKRFRDKWRNYRTADLFQNADLKLNLEKIDLPNESVELVIANHVLEHVDDEKAGSELHRILSAGGILLCMVPIIEGWEKTYENTSIKTSSGRWLHYGQGDHVRYYGRDFRTRIEAGGVKLVKEITAEGPDVVKYGLLRGEKVFVFKKL